MTNDISNSYNYPASQENLDPHNCSQDQRITRIETKTEKIQEEIQELKEVDKSLRKTLTKLDKAVTKFSTLVETLIKNNNKKDINPWWYAIITGVAVFLFMELIKIIK